LWNPQGKRGTKKRRKAGSAEPVDELTKPRRAQQLADTVTCAHQVTAQILARADEVAQASSS
jgi:FixJ family two-component response regulator